MGPRKRKAAFQPCITAAMALATASTLRLLIAATQIRPEEMA